MQKNMSIESGVSGRRKFLGSHRSIPWIDINKQVLNGLNEDARYETEVFIEYLREDCIEITVS